MDFSLTQEPNFEAILEKFPTHLKELEFF